MMMFTGIIEDVGIIRSSVVAGGNRQIEIESSVITSDVKNGDSIAVNGVCLTVVAFSGASFKVEAVHETLSKTSIGTVKPGVRTNLERALRPQDRIGGHFVLGHVDCTSKLLSISAGDGSKVFEFALPPEFERYIVQVGSIAVDGVSLTIAARKKESFSVSIIPHTLETTIFRDYRRNDLVNLEFDILGKYVLNQLPGDKDRQHGRISDERLKNLGF
jgi:riboflavin synthase